MSHLHPHVSTNISTSFDSPSLITLALHPVPSCIPCMFWNPTENFLPENIPWHPFQLKQKITDSRTDKQNIDLKYTHSGQLILIYRGQKNGIYHVGVIIKLKSYLLGFFPNIVYLMFESRILNPSLVTCFLSYNIRL